MSSAYALDIDNLIVEINNGEPPILDGSAKIFAETLISAGLKELPIERQYYVIDEPFTFEVKDTKYQAFPSDELEIDCSIAFDHPFLKFQQLAFSKIDKDIYLKNIAPAKTFCFDFEIEYLQKNNLALGGSFDNAIVIGAQGILNKEALRYSDEFVRHKIMDLIGDLYLAGKRIKAKIKTEKPGHQHNINFVKEFIKRARLV
jgi:UDP-3-O-acyl N-acetylglucosamine deacetylase